MHLTALRSAAVRALWAPEGTCSLPLGRRGLKSGLVEAHALGQELVVVDTLGLTDDVGHPLEQHAPCGTVAKSIPQSGLMNTGSSVRPPSLIGPVWLAQLAGPKAVRDELNLLFKDIHGRLPGQELGAGV